MENNLSRISANAVDDKSPDPKFMCLYRKYTNMQKQINLIAVWFMFQEDLKCCCSLIDCVD